MSLLIFALALAGIASPAQASVFLGKIPVHNGVSQDDVLLEKTLLSDMESVLGSEHRVFTEKRLDSIQNSLVPIFAAIPKNAQGNLGNATLSYALYRLFVQRHAWFVKGLEPFKALSEWNSTSAVSTIAQRVPEYITGLFHTKMGEHGFDLYHTAVLAATIEHLVHKESLLRLSVAYRSLNLTTEDVLSTDDADNVMDTYMSTYILGALIRNISNVSSRWVRFLRANVTDLYPGFPETQKFLREVSESIAPQRDYRYYSDMASLVEEVGDRYGRWQDYECREIKDMLLELEDKGVGGSGRVRLADFYNASLYGGRWQFCENEEYLRKLGAIDDSDPNNLRVIIPNYVNGPSNCVAGSSYYSVCCINECDEILNTLEVKFAAPDATPKAIAQVVAQLPSATVAGDRTLSPWLLYRLEEVAEHHGGAVPLHGRLFAQWLHYAYPRECPYPHVVGATSPQTTEQFVRETRRDFAAEKEAMQQFIDMPLPNQKIVNETSDIQEVLALESAMWTMDEELVVLRPATQASGNPAWQSWLRGIASVTALASTLFSLFRTVDRKFSSEPQGCENLKYYV